MNGGGGGGGVVVVVVDGRGDCSWCVDVFWVVEYIILS